MEPSNKPGRRARRDNDPVPYDEIDRLLVQGEEREIMDGAGRVVTYPTYRDVANRFGVSHALIAQYSKRHNCMERRRELKDKTRRLADDRLAELRSYRVAVTEDDALCFIDECLMQFWENVRAGKVPINTTSDANTLLRVKKYLQGGPDSRRESIRGLPTLEEMQKRHAEFLKRQATFTTGMYGEAGDTPASDPH